MVAFKIYGDFGMERCTENKNLLVKILRNRICYKVKRFASFWLEFWHNTHLLKKLKFKIFQIWTPTKKKLKFSPISPNFGPNISKSGISNICSHLKLIGFQNILMWHFMVVGSCVQYFWSFWDRIFAKNHDFLIKTLKNRICSKIKSLASFSLKFSHNTCITNTNTKKK